MKSLTELLAELEREAIKVGFRADLGMEPGLSDDELHALETRCQILLPYELRELYRWKSGLQRSVNMGAPESMLFHGGFHVASVQAAEKWYCGGSIAHHVKERLDGFEDDPQAVAWLTPRIPDLWTVFNDGCGSYLVADMSGGISAPCPVIEVYKEGYENSPVHPLLYQSLSNMVASTVECFKAGVYQIQGDDPERNYLDDDQDKAEEITARMNPDIAVWQRRVNEKKAWRERHGTAP